MNTDSKFRQYDGGHPYVHFVQFTDEGYQYISYAGNSDEGGEKFERGWQGRAVTDVAFELNGHEPIRTDLELYNLLKFRIFRDDDKSMCSKTA